MPGGGGAMNVLEPKKIFFHKEHTFETFLHLLICVMHIEKTPIKSAKKKHFCLMPGRGGAQNVMDWFVTHRFFLCLP